MQFEKPISTATICCGEQRYGIAYLFITLVLNILKVIYEYCPYDALLIYN